MVGYGLAVVDTLCGLLYQYQNMFASAKQTATRSMQRSKLPKIIKYSMNQKEYAGDRERLQTYLAWSLCIPNARFHWGFPLILLRYRWRT